MAERNDNSRGTGSSRRHAPSRASAARSRVREVPLLRKLLMTMMVLGAMTTAVGAGTFASLSATTTNASTTFQTGSIALSDTVASGTACISNNAAASTDTNTNANCSVMFDTTSGTTATNKRPGESTPVAVHIQNAGTLAGNLTINSAANCSTSAAA